MPIISTIGFVMYPTEKTMTEPVVQREVVITNSQGLHARPTAALVQMMKSFKASVKIEIRSKSADARSMMSVLALGGTTGDHARIAAEGVDAAEAVDAVEALLTTEDDD